MFRTFFANNRVQRVVRYAGIGIVLMGLTVPSWGQVPDHEQEAPLLQARALRMEGYPDAVPSSAPHAPSATARLVSVALEGATPLEALRALEVQGGFRFFYSTDLLPAERGVSLVLERVSARRALEAVLEALGMAYWVAPSGQVVLFRKPRRAAPAPVALQAPPSLEALRPARPAPLRLQTGTITGTVTDSLSGETLPGVNVVIEGTTRGAATGVDGRYRIAALEPGTYALHASFVGYTDKVIQGVEVRDGETTVVDVALTPTEIGLDEVVVIGYGTQEREDLTGAVASVTADEMENAVTTTFDQALQGRVAGVMVMRNSGRPGAGVTVQIRGVNTLGNAAPLYVIDGVPISGESDGVTNPLALVNPANIQSIDILKGASAAAIYGSRASNGVVLITTKRGQAGELRVDYDTYVGAQQLPNQLEVMNLRQFAMYSNRRAEIVGWGAEAQFADPSLLGEGTNWQDVLYRTAPMTKHNLSVSGGNARTRYMLSAGYFYQKGIAISSDFRRYSFRLNLDNQPTSWMQVGTSLAVSRTRENINVTEDNIVNLAIRQKPSIPVKYPDGSWGGPSESQFTLANPVALAKLNTNRRRRSQVLGNLYASIDLLEGLTLRNELNATLGYTNDYVFNPTYSFNARVNELNSASRSASNNTYWQFKNYVTYDDSYEGFGLNAMVGHEVQVSAWDGLSAARERFPSNNIHELGAGDASTATNGSYAGSQSLQSFFSRVNLTYDDRYLLTGSIRADASSKFSSQNRWGYFPSVAVAWRVSNEAFMQNVDFIDQLKLRAGYGFVGNQNIGGYLYGDTYAVVPTQWGSGVRPATLGNPGLRWESTESVNVGMDLSVLNRRATLTVDAYVKQTHGLLLQLPLPLYSGTSGTQSLSPPVDNIGSLKNRGLEFALNTVNLQGAFQWESGIVLTMNRNEVTELNSDGAFINSEIEFFDTVSRTMIGQPVGQFYGYVVEGVFENEEDVRKHAHPENVTNADGTPIINQANGVWVGDLKFKDLNGDGVITDADRAFIGNPMPNFQYGITNRFSYKGFDLSVFINGTYGNDIFNQVRRQNENPAGDFGMLASVFDYARIALTNPDDPNASMTNISDVYITNPQTTVPRISGSDVYGNSRVSSRFVEDGSYLRIQNVTLGYTLPANLIRRFSLRELRVYASVKNLYTFTAYSGYDPEIGSPTASPLLLGVDYGRYPTPRVLTVGINVGL